MSPLRRPLIAVAALAFLLLSENRASSEWIPPFDLHRRTAEAESIVHGRLDAKGKLIVDTTLKGKAAANHLVLTNGAEVFTALQKLEKQARSIEVVVYLRQSNGKWTIEHGEHGAVGFLNNGVCLVYEDDNNLLRGGAVLQRHPTLSREQFLKSARAAVASLERRKLLLALPPSADRMRKIVAFWLKLERNGRYHYSLELSRALMPLVSVEEKALVDILKSSHAGSKPLLLDLVGYTARGKAAFDAVADLLDRKQPSAVRKKAVHALSWIDPYRAQERLIPLLRIDEPELHTVLTVLCWGDPFRLNPAVVESLRKLTGAMRRLHRTDRQVLVMESHMLAGVLGHYGHPKLLACLVEWAQADDHETAEWASDVMRRLTGLAPRGDGLTWERWWKKAKPLLEADYDLRNAAGRRKWYRAYRAGDASTRRILLRLWAFEPAPDEAAMVREAGGEGGNVAKEVLAALWAQGRLSSATKGDLVEKFLAVRLEEVPGRPATKSRELRIVGEKRFPFPPTVWVEWRATFAIGEKQELKVNGSFNCSSLGEKVSPQSLGTMGGGSYPGTPQARALLEMRDATPYGDGKAFWKRTWKLGPIRLREAK